MKQFRFFDPKDMKDIANVKRIMEYQALIPGFVDRLNADPEAVLLELGMNFSIKDISFGPNTFENGDVRMHPLYPGTPAVKYAKFMDRKLEHRSKLRDKCEPVNPAMKKWRARQIARCMIQLGVKSYALIHAPFSIELSDGCSVGCDFCALASKGLQSVFRYTPENAKLFNDVLYTAKEIIGDGAGMGTLYFASEPLDDPDYEKFKEDYTRCFDMIPQITTARSTMNIERLRPLLREINETQKNIYRFSILSEEMARQVFDAFSPEELILTELLPQYEEAPTSALIKSGRGATEDEYGDTISCMSGFVVNLARRDVKLTTPVWSSKDHPTGEAILEIGTFSNGNEFGELILGMISRHMKNIIASDDEIMLEEGISLQDEGDKVSFVSDKGIKLTMEVKGPTDIFDSLVSQLSGGFKTKREVVANICAQNGGVAASTEMLYYILNKWWNLGIIRTKSGKF